METVLLGVTLISLVFALVMSMTAWRLARAEKRHSAARVAALSIAASAPDSTSLGFQVRAEPAERPVAKAPWAPVRLAMDPPAAPAPREVSHASGFLGASSARPHRTGGGQRVLAVTSAMLLIGLLGGLAWMMSEPRGTTATAVGPNSPLELVSLRHDRASEKLAVSGLVRNPAAGKPVERLAAVVFLFDRRGALLTSAQSDVDFLKLGAGDESPFVVSLDAPATVARYRVSFRTQDGVVPHIDRRGAIPLAAEGERPVSVTLK